MQAQLWGGLAIAIALAGCRPASDYATLAVGTYDNGSGRLGLATLIQITDAEGAPAGGTWTLTLSDPEGPLRSNVPIDLGGSTGTSALWWPDLAPSFTTAYQARLEDEAGHVLTADGVLVDGPALPAPAAQLSADGTGLTWAAPDGARSFRCIVTRGGAEQLNVLATQPGCDVSALPAGPYQAQILAFSADLTQVVPDASSFFVSEGALAFALGASALQVAAAGGSIDFGAITPGLALGLAIGAPDGTPTTSDWSVSVVGPGISSSAPLTFAYPATARRHLAWSYDAEAREGRYTFVATPASGESISGSFVIGAPAPLPKVTDVTASPQPNGAADVTFVGSADAASYFVSVWNHATAGFAAGGWSSATNRSFAVGTFAAGQSYDVYVAAANVDVATAGPLPAQVSVSENTFFPTSFVAQ